MVRQARPRGDLALLNWQTNRSKYDPRRPPERECASGINHGLTRWKTPAWFESRICFPMFPLSFCRKIPRGLGCLGCSCPRVSTRLIGGGIRQYKARLQTKQALHFVFSAWPRDLSDGWFFRWWLHSSEMIP